MSGWTHPLGGFFVFLHITKIYVEALALDCERNVLDADLVIAILDGPDTDSGTSVEAGMKYYRRASLGRTD